MEQPIMVGVSILAVRWVIRRLGVPPLWPRRLSMGCIALGLMLLAEFSVVLCIRGLTIRAYFESRDPVSGAAYCIALGAFAVMPVFITVLLNHRADLLGVCLTQGASQQRLSQGISR